MTESARQQAADAIARHERFCLVTHERPDGDALGSLLGMHRLLIALGRDSVMVVDADDLPLAPEYSFLDVAGSLTAPPSDLAERVVIYLDCGNIERNPVDLTGVPHGTVINIDHHHDNTLFGDINFVAPEAACTTEMLWELAGDLGVSIDEAIGTPLYVGLVTDSGRFMYDNTTAKAHRMAAELLEAGVDAHRIYRRLYEGVSAAKLELLGRALAGIERHCDGALAIVQLQREDFDAAGATDNEAEGIIDHLRALDGVSVAAFGRAVDRPGAAGERQQKVSLRSTDGVIDVSAIARAGGGGGHRRAAGFTTALDGEALLAFLCQQIDAQRTVARP